MKRMCGESLHNRISDFFDKESFVEITCFSYKKRNYKTSNLLTGVGKIEGKKVCAIMTDFADKGGSLGKEEIDKIIFLQKYACMMKMPLIIFCDSGGARIQEGIVALDGLGSVLYNCVKFSGIIPQIAIISDTCAGGAAILASLCDFVFMVTERSKMFLTGPAVIEQATGERTSKERLGGVRVHLKESGIVHFGYYNIGDCKSDISILLSHISNKEKFKNIKRIFKNKCYMEKTNLSSLIPENQKNIYDIRKVIEAVVDKYSFFEVQKQYAQNAIVGFAKIEERSIGIVANQPNEMCGAIDTLAAKKMTEFIYKCERYNIPIIVFVDTPGFYPGEKQERDGIVREAANLIASFIDVKVFKLSVILRKAFGGAYIAMNSKGIGANVVFAWAGAQVEIMDANGKKVVLGTCESINDIDSKWEEKGKYGEGSNLDFAVQRGYISEVILPEETREKIVLKLKKYL